MQVILVAVGQKQPTWVEQAYAEYAQRMPPDLSLILKEVKAEPRTQGKSPEAMMRAEAERIRAALPPRCPHIALDERGKAYTSVALASQLSKWQDQHSQIGLVIGGPDGLDSEFKAAALGLMRLSDFTLPHGMARVILAEQLYRAWSILAGHPYHRS